MFCRNCGKELNEGADVCLNCGAAVNKVSFDFLSKKIGNYDVLTIALLCFFLGGLGVHNFLLGETNKGILKIALTLCFGIGCILALIDFIKILTDNYTVDPGKWI